eukprot:8387889-Pyramimonas_sp.AAC.1
MRPQMRTGMSPPGAGRTSCGATGAATRGCARSCAGASRRPPAPCLRAPGCGKAPIGPSPCPWSSEKSAAPAPSCHGRGKAAAPAHRGHEGEAHRGQRGPQAADVTGASIAPPSGPLLSPWPSAQYRAPLALQGPSRSPPAPAAPAASGRGGHPAWSP